MKFFYENLLKEFLKESVSNIVATDHSAFFCD